MSEKISLYNPRDTPAAQLEAMLTGREPLLKEVLGSLQEQIDAPTRQHWLLRGPRGIGKTHLTGIIYHRVQSDEVLSKAYLPLWLGEADVYEVYSPATLLLRICERLVEAISGAELAQKLRTLEGGGDEDVLFEELAGLLTEEAERQDRVLLVLMENLDALFESFAPKHRTEQTRQLRALLLGNPRFLFISTTPTAYLKELSDPKAPLFAHLKERKLSPLQVEEVGSLFANLTRITGRKELLGSGSDASLKQRIIHQLTGGLPRSVVMAFEILRDKEGIQSLVEDLRTFLDAQTAYFEARLSRLAPRERAIVTALALADQNLTLKEVSDKSLLPEKSLSTIMARLQQEGHVEVTDGTGGKGTIYGLSEGLFRIWYQYRKGRLLLKPLVEFLAYWYEPEEIQSVVDVMRQRVTQEGLSTHSMKLTLIQIQAALELATSEQGRLARERIWEECRRAVAVAQKESSQVEFDAYSQTLEEIIRLIALGKEQEAKLLLAQTLADGTSLHMRALQACQALVQAANHSPTEREPIKIKIFNFITENFGTSEDIHIQALSIPAQMRLCEILLEDGQYGQALDHMDSLLRIVDTTMVKVQFLQKEMQTVSWITRTFRIQALNRMGRQDEALRACNNFQNELRRHGSADSRIILLRVLVVHATILINQAMPLEAERLLQEAVHLQLDPSDTMSQASLATVKQGLIVIRWVTKQDIHPDAATLRGLLQFFGHPLGTSLFLDSPSLFLKTLPRRELIDWLREVLNTELSAERRALLQLHLSVLEFADTALAKVPEAHRRIKQALGRAPVEMRELFTSVLDRLRTSPSGEKKP